MSDNWVHPSKAFKDAAMTVKIKKLSAGSYYAEHGGISWKLIKNGKYKRMPWTAWRYDTKTGQYESEGSSVDLKGARWEVQYFVSTRNNPEHFAYKADLYDWAGLDPEYQ
jgi:hypothetical protein